MSDAIPDEWVRTTLGDVMTLEYGRSLPELLRLEGDVPVYGSNGVVGQHTEHFVGERGIVVGRKGSAGSVHVTTGPFWPIDTTYYVRPRKDLNFDWLAATLHQTNLGALNEATGVPGLNRDNAYRQPILLPPLDEQRRIAAVLRSADQAVTAAQVVVEQTRRCLDMLVSELMQKGTRALKVTSSYAGLPPDWKESRCDAFFVLQRGFDITEKQAVPGPYSVISSSGPAYFHSEAAVQGPVVITGRKGRLGTVFFSDDPCWPHDTTLWVKDFKENVPRFVYWKLRSMKLEAYDAATSVPTLNRNNVHALTVRFPPPDEQREIASILDAEWSVIERQEAQVHAAQKMKEVLASDLLSGRVRVPA
jgi:type I restriction enzyme S subunit